MGAEVIKVEEPGKGDDTRGWPPFAGGEATYFMGVNRGKQSLTLDLKATEGQAILRSSSSRGRRAAGELPARHHGAARLRLRGARPLNPRLVYCSISGFGESGPEARRPGYDLIVQGESGVMDLTGFPDGPPVKVGDSDRRPGVRHDGRARHRAGAAGPRTGRAGQKVEIAMLEVMAALLTYQAGLYFATGASPSGAGTSTRRSCPTRSSRRRTATSPSASRTTRSGRASARRSAIRS